MIEAKFYLLKNSDRDNVHCEITENEDVIADLKITDNHDLFDLNYIENRSGHKFSEISFFENEIFIYFYIKKITKIDFLLDKYSIEKVQFVGNNELFLFIKSFCKKRNIKVVNETPEFLSQIGLLLTLIKTILILIAGSFYVGLLPMFHRSKIKKQILNSGREFALIHSKASYNKIRNVLQDNILYYYDSYNLKLVNNSNHFSLYSALSFFNILINIITTPFETIKLFSKVFSSSKELLGYKGAVLSLSYSAIRIPHFILIQKCYKKIFKTSTSKIYYSGEKESRHGALAMKIGHENKMQGVCIPHGLAYSYKYPLGVFGDKYYCITEMEAEFLNAQYKSQKFLFDKKLVQKMFSVYSEPKDQSIIFFPDPRRVHVNYKLINILQGLLPVVKIKLHPLDSKDNYSQFENIEFVEDFAESISGNICISRNSTVLIEAIYNNSLPISVLIDSEDRFDFENTFPSLRTEGIKKVYTQQQLKEILEEYLN